MKRPIDFVVIDEENAESISFQAWKATLPGHVWLGKTDAGMKVFWDEVKSYYALPVPKRKRRKKRTK